MPDQDCSDCAFAEAWKEPHGEDAAICDHRERFGKFWGENDGEDFAENLCPHFEDREAVRAAVNGVEL